MTLYSAQNSATSGGDSDFSFLSGTDEYTRYFNLLSKAGALLMKCYDLSRSTDTYEAQRVQEYLDRLLFTVETLRMKYTHGPTNRRMLWVDLSESGFPNAHEVEALSTALLHRKDRLRVLPTATLLKQLILDHLFRYQEDPPDLLWQLAERTYLEMLHEDKLFLPFVALKEDLDAPTFSEAEGMRHYRCSWGCYDYTTNRPYLHVMTFDQDASEPPMEEGSNQLKLIEMLQTEGSRAPDVAILAMAIDHAMDSVHPKILKRICLGPLYVRSLMGHENLGKPDDRDRALQRLMASSERDDDFLLLVTDEIVFSKRQEISKSLFSSKGQVREVFAIPEEDPECYRRRASVVHQTALMSHGMAQHLDPTVEQRIPELRGARILTYNERGEVHGF